MRPASASFSPSVGDRRAAKNHGGQTVARRRTEADVTPFAERIAKSPMSSMRSGVAMFLRRCRRHWTRTRPAHTPRSCSRAPKVAAFLTAAFSGSPYLSALSVRDPELLAACLAEDPDTHLPEAGARLAAALAQVPSEAEVMALLRQVQAAHALS